METFLFLFEMLGTIAFAASGAVLGVRKGLDVFGVCFLGLTTACGGGMVRDVLLGNTPPARCWGSGRDWMCSASVSLA